MDAGESSGARPRLLFFINEAKPRAVELGAQLTTVLNERGVSWATSRPIEAEAMGRVPTGSFSKDVDGWAGVVLGGDGTLLRAARFAPAMPLLSVNLGTVGFLAAVEPDEALGAVEDLLESRLSVEERFLIAVSVDGAGEVTGLNEVVLGRCRSRRTAELAVEVDGEHLWSWQADGVLVSTPTGSTAYALSAGGPLVMPQADVLLVVPICAHTLMDRAVVLPSSAAVVLAPIGEGDSDDLAVTVDGTAIATGAIKKVRVGRSEESVRLLGRPAHPYEHLCRKLVDWSVAGVGK